jgi:protoporphyrinogen oxidase
VLEAAKGLGYRDFLTVALVVDQADVFADNWIYIHEPNVHVGRIQNYKNWSIEMVPDPRQSVLGLEYFCFEGDDLWTMADDKLIELAKHELSLLKLTNGARVTDGAVVRMPRAYPVYDDDYAARVACIRDFIERQLPNVQAVGRNGMHRYNNQDHAMLTGLLAARNLRGDGPFDPWKVNSDAEYLEEGPRDEVPVPWGPPPPANPQASGSTTPTGAPPQAAS